VLTKLLTIQKNQQNAATNALYIRIHVIMKLIPNEISRWQALMNQEHFWN